MTSQKSGWTRRDFVKTSSVAAASLAFAPSIAHAQEKRTLRAGLIGCGGRGTGAASDFLSSSPNVELIAMADLFENRLQGSRNHLKSKKGYNVEDSRVFIGFDAYKKLLELDLDVVLMATPPGFRPIQFEAAINAGKNVFMEKPVAVDPPGIRRVIAAGEKAKEKGLAVVAGTQRRHQFAYVNAMKAIHQGAIGELTSACVYWNGGELWHHGDNPEWSRMEYQCRNWYYFTWLCGDHIVEQHIHNLDVANWALQAVPARAVGLGGRQVRIDPKYGHIYDHHAIDFEYPNGVHVLSMCRQQNRTKGNVSESLCGTKGRSNPNGRIYDLKGKEIWRHDGPNPNPYVQEHTDLVNSIRAEKPLNEAKQVAESTLVAIMGREACYTGQAITWDEIYNSNLDLSPEKYDWYDIETPPVAMPGHTKLERDA